jgi:aspartyl/asparaginyl-tRNA synthetase
VFKKSTLLKSLNTGLYISEIKPFSRKHEASERMPSGINFLSSENMGFISGGIKRISQFNTLVKQLKELNG